MKILVIIPAYNEEENIERVVNNLIENYPQYDYVIVNDGSRDNTARICKDNGYNLIDLPINLGLAGGFVFVLSALKIPSVTGSCSHPTGVGLGAILFGPTVMTVIGTIVLLFQAILLAHGGLTTLGANVFSMAIVGPIVSYGIFIGLKNTKINRSFTVFLAAAVGNLATYVVTATQLSLVFQDPANGLMGSLVKFLSVFAVTQLPLAIVEGLLTAIIYNLLVEYKNQGVISIENI